MALLHAEAQYRLTTHHLATKSTNSAEKCSPGNTGGFCMIKQQQTKHVNHIKHIMRKPILLVHIGQTHRYQTHR